MHAFSLTQLFPALARSLPISYGLSQTVLVLTAAVLFYVAFTDLRSFRIRNEFVGVLAGLYLVHAFTSGRWVLLPWHLGFAFIIFVVLLFAYARRWLGGGDVKLLTVAALWTGVSSAFVFCLCLLAFSSAHALLTKINWLPSYEKDGRAQIAYAPSIAAALIAVFMLGYFAPLTYTALGPM